MIYVQAGLYAEGRTDYDFLIPLLERLLQEMCPRVCVGSYEIPTPIGVDADVPTNKRRQRIAAAVAKYAGTCQLFVIHTDADGDAVTARDERVTPGIDDARHELPPEWQNTRFVACVPVQMIEAWMLADEEPFRQLLGRKAVLDLPKDPEEVREPKRVLDALLSKLSRRRPLGLYEAFGANVSLASLRRLSAFRAFEDELQAGVAAIARVPATMGARRG